MTARDPWTGRFVSTRVTRVTKRYMEPVEPTSPLAKALDHFVRTRTPKRRGTRKSPRVLDPPGLPPKGNRVVKFIFLVITEIVCTSLAISFGLYLVCRVLLPEVNLPVPAYGALFWATFWGYLSVAAVVLIAMTAEGIAGGS
jgi:hypothetical protein